MKKAMLLSLLFTAFGVLTAQAVIVTWSSDEVLTGTTSAQLVYVASGNVADVLTGTVLGTASGAAIDGTVLYSQESLDSVNHLGGGYFIVLFNDNNEYSASTFMAYDDTTRGAFSADDYSWTQGGSFNPSGTSEFGSWTPVPEPCSAALLCLGAAALALRRRKMR